MISSWQRWVPVTTTGLVTGPDADGQCSIEDRGALDERFHVPGPLRGTSATSKAGDSTPVSAPLETPTLGAGAIDLTFETVGSLDLVTLVTGRDGIELVVLVVAGTDVVGAIIGIDVEGTVDEPWTVVVGVGELEPVVTVNSSTSSNKGLDHINR